MIEHPQIFTIREVGKFRYDGGSPAPQKRPEQHSRTKQTARQEDGN